MKNKFEEVCMELGNHFNRFSHKERANKNNNNCLLRKEAKEAIIVVFICDIQATGCTHPQLRESK
jgi:hypothetical protein